MTTNSLVEPAIRATGIIKSYGGATVLKGVDFIVPGGTAFGLVGVNGAGKTTLIKCMLDFCSLDGGKFRIFGTPHTLTRARERVAFVPENFVPPHYLTCYEFIELTSSLAGDRFKPERVEEIFGELRLDRSALRKPVRQLSKGMTQKLGLAGCLLVERDLYLLDEPMSGLDPASRVAVKGVLSRLSREGRTLFFTSHVLSDVEELCSFIAVLDRGEICFHGSPKQMCERYAETNLERAFMRSIHVAEPENAH